MKCDTRRNKMANRHEMFKARLKEIGMYDDDSDYGGALGIAVEELSETFAEQGHSGASAVITVGLFNKLMDEYHDSESKMWKNEGSI